MGLKNKKYFVFLYKKDYFGKNLLEMCVFVC